MPISSRASLALGLGLLGVAGFVSVTNGQDGTIRKPAAAAGAPAATATPTFKQTVVATIDLEAVLRGYEKTKFQVEQLKAESLARQAQLKAVYAEAQQIAKEMESLQPASKDFKERGNKITELKAKLEAGKETYERENQMKYIEIMAGSYKEIQDMTTAYARSRHIDCVIKTSAEPANSQDPDSVMAAMAKPIMYSDPALDISTSVLWNLNQQYVKAGGQVVKAAAPGEATTDPAAERTAAPGATRPAAPANRPATPKGSK